MQQLLERWKGKQINDSILDYDFISKLVKEKELICYVITKNPEKDGEEIFYEGINIE